MKKLNEKQKPWIIAIAVIVALILAYIFGAFAVPNLLAFLIDATDNKETVYYDDGTIVYHGNGPLYDHVLFDHYSVSHEGEGGYSIRRIQPFNEEYYDTDMINKFTFDKNGYIAYHVADDKTNEYRLFCAENETFQTFATMKELYDFCTEKIYNSIPGITVCILNRHFLTTTDGNSHQIHRMPHL